MTPAKTPPPPKTLPSMPVRAPAPSSPASPSSIHSLRAELDRVQTLQSSSPTPAQHHRSTSPFRTESFSARKKLEKTLRILGCNTPVHSIPPTPCPFVEKLKKRDQANEALLYHQYQQAFVEFEEKINQFLPLTQEAQLNRLQLLDRIQHHCESLLNSESAFHRHFEQHLLLKQTVQIPYACQSDFIELVHRLDPFSKKGNDMFETLSADLIASSPEDERGRPRF